MSPFVTPQGPIPGQVVDQQNVANNNDEDGDGDYGGPSNLGNN